MLVSLDTEDAYNGGLVLRLGGNSNVKPS